MSRRVDNGPGDSRRWSHGAYRRTLVAVALGLSVTVLVVVLPNVRFAYRSPDGRLVLETAAALIAALVAVLFYGRFRRSGSVQSLLLVYAMGMLGVAALVLVVLPVIAGAAPGSTGTTWGALVVRQMAAVLILTAAVVGPRAVLRHNLTRDTLVALALLVTVLVLVQVLSAGLPTAVETSPPPETSALPSFDAHPFVLVAQGLNLMCFAAAAVAFTRQSARTGDTLAGWVGAASAVGAFARVNYLLYPSLYTEWFYTGDLLRLGFYLLLLVGAWREIDVYWSAQTEAAVQLERRRLARELHDGALQEIGYIRSQVDGIDGHAAERIRSATERALNETRAALMALTVTGDEPFMELLRRSVAEVADRYNVTVRWALDPEAKAPPRHREDLLRIAREAVTNAARHGQARTVWLTLSPGMLNVTDDGRGFDTSAATRPGSFGLTSMRDRAAAIDGVLQVESTPDQGTRVRATWSTKS
jgi:signal transduction histidine kinase